MAIKRSKEPESIDIPDLAFEPKQARSKRSLERLLVSAEECIAQQGYDAVVITDICERAGLSVGAFYRRFASKEVLASIVHERALARASETMRRAFDPAREQGHSLKEILRRTVEFSLVVLSENAGLQRASLLRSHTDHEFAERETRIREEYHQHMVSMLLRHRHEIGHPRPKVAAEFCAYQLLAIFDYRVASPLESPSTLSDRHFVTETVTSCLSYLQVDGLR